MQLTIAPSGSLTPGTGYLLDTTRYDFVVLSCPLTSTDTVAVQIVLPDGSSAVNAPDINGVTTGLSSTAQARIYAGGPTYKITKTGSASAVNAYADLNGSK